MTTEQERVMQEAHQDFDHERAMDGLPQVESDPIVQELTPHLVGPAMDVMDVDEIVSCGYCGCLFWVSIEPGAIYFDRFTPATGCRENCACHEQPKRVATGTEGR